MALASLTAPALAGVAAVVLRSDGRDRWDVVVQHDLLSVHGWWASDAARAATDLAAPLVLVGVALLAVLLLWCAAHRPLVAVGVLAVPVVTAALAQVLAVAFDTVRPTASRLLGLPVRGGSFPSAATADADALWGVLALAGVLLVRRRGGRALCVTVGVLVAVAVGWGQLYATRAWPTDVLAGSLLAGTAVGGAAGLLAAWPAPLPTNPLPGGAAPQGLDTPDEPPSTPGSSTLTG